MTRVVGFVDGSAESAGQGNGGPEDNGEVLHANGWNIYRSVYSHDRRVLSTPVGYSHDDQSEAR